MKDNSAVVSAPTDALMAYSAPPDSQDLTSIKKAIAFCVNLGPIVSRIDRHGQ